MRSTSGRSCAVDPWRNRAIEGREERLQGPGRSGFARPNSPTGDEGGAGVEETPGDDCRFAFVADADAWTRLDQRFFRILRRFDVEDVSCQVEAVVAPVES